MKTVRTALSAGGALALAAAVVLPGSAFAAPVNWKPPTQAWEQKSYNEGITISVSGSPTFSAMHPEYDAMPSGDGSVRVALGDGAQFEYDFVVTNTSDEVQDINAGLNVREGSTVVWGDGSEVVYSDGVSYTDVRGEDLAPGASFTVSVSGTVDEGGYGIASLSAYTDTWSDYSYMDIADHEPVEETKAQTFTAVPASGSTVIPGQTISYEIDLGQTSYTDWDETVVKQSPWSSYVYLSEAFPYLDIDEDSILVNGQTPPAANRSAWSEEVFVSPTDAGFQTFSGDDQIDSSDPEYVITFDGTVRADVSAGDVISVGSSSLYLTLRQNDVSLRSLPINRGLEEQWGCTPGGAFSEEGTCYVEHVVAIPVTPPAPTFTPSETCDVEGVVTLPEVEGLTYAQTREGQTITVTASADEGTILAEGAVTSWTFEVPAVDPCPSGGDDTDSETETPTVPSDNNDGGSTSGTDSKPSWTGPAEGDTLAYTGSGTPLLAIGAGVLALLSGVAALAMRRRVSA